MSLATPAKFIRSLRAHEIEPVVFCTYLIYTSARSDDPITSKQTADEFNIDEEAGDWLHDLAAEFDLVEYMGDRTNRVSVNSAKVTEFIQFLSYFENYATESEIELLADDRVHDVELTVSVPDAFEGRSAELMARLTRFVRNAESELIVVTPFFTRFGVDVFVDYLAQATGRGIRVTVLTRDVTGEKDNADHVQRIHETVTETGDVRNLQLFEYDSDHGNLHAKALIADGRRAYVGSANFTNYSLKTAIEIGLIVQGPVVNELAGFFSAVLSSSDTMRLDQTAFSS